MSLESRLWSSYELLARFLISTKFDSLIIEQKIVDKLNYILLRIEEVRAS